MKSNHVKTKISTVTASTSVRWKCSRCNERRNNIMLSESHASCTAITIYLFLRKSWLELTTVWKGVPTNRRNVLNTRVRKRYPGEILNVLITKFLKMRPVKIGLSWWPQSTWADVQLKTQPPRKEFLLKSGESWPPNSWVPATIKSWINGKEALFSGHSFVLFGQWSQYSECIRLTLSFTQQATQIWQSHFFSPLSMA